MKSTDEGEVLLAKAGARRCVDQLSAPDRVPGRPFRGSRRWGRWMVPIATGASVVVIAAAAVLAPVQSVAASNKPQIVRDGDAVEVDGEVVAVPGEPVRYCVPAPMPMPMPATATALPSAAATPLAPVLATATALPSAPATLPAPVPVPATAPATAPARSVVGPGLRSGCGGGEYVEVTGVELDRLSSPTTVDGVRTGFAHLVGTWAGGRIAVERQGAPVPDEPAVEEVPCRPPAGGWREGGDAEVITPAVERFVADRSAQLQEPWIGWPEGYESDQKPGTTASKPSVVMIGVAHGNLAAIRAALTPLVAGNLCVLPVKLSQDEVQKLHAAANDLPTRELDIYSVGIGAGERPVNVQLRVLDERVAAALSPLGLDNLKLEPAVKPVR